MRKTSLWLLVGILILAAFLRLWQLGSNPAGFFCDEASVGYNAYSILRSGRDEYGVPFPLFFQAFGEYKSPVLIYSAIPSIALFGLNEFSVRLTSAFYGILSVIAIYFLGKVIFGTEAGLLSALFLAISPWHIHFSRVSLEVMPVVLFTTLATYLWIKYWQKKNTNLISFFLSIIFFALALYSYFSARIFIPFFTLGLIITQARKLFSDKKRLMAALILTILLIMPLVRHTFSGPGLTRWNQVKGKKNINQMIGLYLNHFSPDFLFTKGDIDFPGQSITRHSVRGLGELYLWQLPLIILGLYVCGNKLNFRKNGVLILLFWLTLYPLGTIFTDAPGPQSTRSIIGVIPFQIISAMGFIWLVDYIKKWSVDKKGCFALYSFLSLVVFSIAISFISYVKLLAKYPLYSSDYWGWQYGPREIITYFLEHQSEYDQLIMIGEFNAPDIFLKFYGQGKCQKCIIGGLGLVIPGKRQLFAIKPNDIEKLNSGYEFVKQKEIVYPDGSLAFEVGEAKPPQNTYK